MKTIKHKIWMATTLASTIILSSACMKDFLDVKRDKSQVIPVSLEDYYAVFNNLNMNYYTSYLLGEIGSDDYYLLPSQWQGLSVPFQKNGYIWADEIYEGEAGDDWNRGYEKILSANFVLEGVEEIRETPANKLLRDELMGSAYFYRGTNHFLLAQLFCKQYDAATANEDLGVPIRTTSNINVTNPRATLQATYNQIIHDLQLASNLLPSSERSYNTRPYKAAALGMLANVYLQIGDYATAHNYADTALSLASEILDYNEVQTSINLPFPLYGRNNREIIFYSHMSGVSILLQSRLTIDSVLYDSYGEHDLRKQAFFFVNGGRNAFKGSYSGNANFMFSGLTTPELLLIRAESNARLGNINNAVADLNLLLANRFKPEHFQPIANNISQQDLLTLVLSERRKELIYRGRRWHDLKRFQKDPNLAKPLTRILGDEVYTLPINSPKWVWPIPPDAISQGGYVQNER